MSESTSHMHDHEAHVQAVEEDLEYYRTKRLEPRIFRMARKGIVTLSDILKAQTRMGSGADPAQQQETHKTDTESRIRALEDALNDYVRGIALVSSDLVKGVDIVIEDGRKERGDYDDFFRIAKKHHEGSLEERIAGLEQDLRDYHLLLRAVTRALILKGLVDPEELRRRSEAASAPSAWNGARIVARAWADPEFKGRLMAKGREAVRELGIPPGRLGKLGVVENTEAVHNVVVCTLCSCYPYDLLGDTPWWYKQDIYKTRIVADPRGTLEEMFRLALPPGVDVRVYDSTSDVRYMVIPRRPAGTEGMREEELARLVTQESLIGVAEPLGPSSLAGRTPQEVRPTYV
jgi:nitrile hydratase